MKLKLIQSGRSGSDCTAPYYVEISGRCNVGEFVKYILTQFPNEWGYIGIDDGSILGSPKVEYAKGVLITENVLKDLENCTVINATASGGWSRMDYYLRIESEDNQC